MEKYSEAETMHLKAIEIKEAILGKNDYEVALSIGHLVSMLKNCFSSSLSLRANINLEISFDFQALPQM
jgi:hypothetical protein